MRNSTLSTSKLKNTKKALLLFVLFSIIVNNPILAQGNCPDGLVEIVIPVAVHYDNTFNDCVDAQCLIDAAINNIASLNADFASENSDKNKYNQLNSIDPLAHPLGALGDGTCISFCLATQNHPEGEDLTNGQPAITIGRYTFNENGPGALAWEGYVNIFVQDDAPAIGRANTLSEANGDGVRIRADVWGGPEFICESIGNLNSSDKYNLGRTLTHELGHYFDLQHTYSPDLGDCSDHDTISISSRIILTEQGTLLVLYELKFEPIKTN